MTISEIYHHFLQNIRDTKWPEWISTIAQIASVWYARKNNILVFPTGIIGVLLAAYVYFFMIDPALYADASLNIYYFAMSAYGWYNWVQKKDDSQYTYPISWCSKKELWTGILLFIFFWVTIYLVLHFFTDSNTVFGDSLVSSFIIPFCNSLTCLRSGFLLTEQEAIPTMKMVIVLTRNNKENL